jgi:hypothetical protein
MIDEKKLERIGFWVGFTVFASLGVLIYWVHSIIVRKLGFDWADILTLIPSFCAMFIIAPVQSKYVWIMRQKKCAKEGHIFESVDVKDGPSYISCKRCFTYHLGNIDDKRRP